MLIFTLFAIPIRMFFLEKITYITPTMKTDVNGSTVVMAIPPETYQPAGYVILLEPTDAKYYVTRYLYITNSDWYEDEKSQNFITLQRYMHDIPGMIVYGLNDIEEGTKVALGEKITW